MSDGLTTAAERRARKDKNRAAAEAAAQDRPRSKAALTPEEVEAAKAYKAAKNRGRVATGGDGMAKALRKLDDAGQIRQAKAAMQRLGRIHAQIVKKDGEIAALTAQRTETSKRLSDMGVSMEDQAQVCLGADGKPISRETLRKRFAAEYGNVTDQEPDDD